jgi:DNA-binding NtrC family response regulator
MECLRRFDAPARGTCSEIIVVIVDDDDGFRNALAASLREDGHQVAEYAAPSALPPLPALSGISVLVTDFEMPGSDGLALADAFHAVHPGAPVILATACAEGSLQAQVAARGFLRLHRKSMGYDDLHGLLHELTQPPAVAGLH